MRGAPTYFSATCRTPPVAQSPSPAEALAAAVLDRLAAGAEARLDGLGVLRRTHEAARLEAHPDGARVMHPPRNDVHFEDERAGLPGGAEPEAP